MRILVTGATGFVGRWLVRELEASGHVAIGTPSSRELDITDPGAVSALVASARPDAVAHLAGVSYARDASRDPAYALAVNEGGTRAVLAAAAETSDQRQSIPVLVSGSSEVYGRPRPDDLPLREHAPLRTDQPYGLSKLAQERAALEIAVERGVPVVVTRSFNHTGPGQRLDFVAPALVSRVLEARRTGTRDVAVGNIDVRRDLGDVRDVARAYRLLLEGLTHGDVPSGTIVNVATGQAVSIRRVLEIVCRAAGHEVQPKIDPGLLRQNDPPVIVGDHALLNGLTGWEPRVPLETTLADLVSSLAAPEDPAAERSR